VRVRGRKNQLKNSINCEFKKSFFFLNKIYEYLFFSFYFSSSFLSFFFYFIFVFVYPLQSLLHLHYFEIINITSLLYDINIIVDTVH
jgi:hypothetical protein